MKKFFCYFVMALCVGFAMTSCGDDDDDNGVKNYTTEKYKSGATSYNLDQGVVIDNNGNASVTGVSLTESGKVVVEVIINGKKKYVTYDGELGENGVITVKSGKQIVGTVQKVSSRAGDVNIIINLTISVPGYGNYTFTTTNPVQAVEIAQAAAGDLVATWKVERMKVTLDFDEKTDASAETKAGKGGDLNEFLKLAQENDVKLTDEEENQLKKEIVSITIDGFKLFSIQYKDGTTDAATWEGEDSMKALELLLKDDSMGNKFLNSQSQVDILYPGNDKVVLKITSRLEEDKCTGTLTVNLTK